MVMMNMVQSINLALREEMERDPSVVLLGEDVGVDGGVFRVTDGLLDRVRGGEGDRHPAGRGGHRRGGHRHGHERPAPGGRDPVHGVHLSDLEPDDLPCGPDAQPHPGSAHRPHGDAHPLRGGREGAGASFGEHRGPVLPDPRAQGGGAIHAVGGQGPADLVHSRPGPGHIPGADAQLSHAQGGGARAESTSCPCRRPGWCRKATTSPSSAGGP